MNDGEVPSSKSGARRLSLLSLLKLWLRGIPMEEVPAPASAARRPVRLPALPFAPDELAARARDGFGPGDVDRLAVTAMVEHTAKAELAACVNQMKAILAAQTINKFAPLRIPKAVIQRLPKQYDVKWTWVDKHGEPAGNAEAAHLLVEMQLPAEPHEKQQPGQES